MENIRKLEKSDFSDFVLLTANAYPGFGTDWMGPFFDRLLEDPFLDQYGYFENDVMLGTYRLHLYTMNVWGREMEMGGLGGVAVDLSRKREGICRRMLVHFIELLRQKHIELAGLYPFSSDFYRRMGFGYGAGMHQYRLRPSYIRRQEGKSDIFQVGQADIGELIRYYNARAAEVHGMILRPEDSRKWEMSMGLASRKLFACRRQGRITGYLSLEFINVSPDNRFEYDLEVDELLYDDRETLLQLMAFLRSQADQVNHLIIDSPDDELFYAFENVGKLDTGAQILGEYHRVSDCGLGIMYRLVDISRFAENLSRPFGLESLRLKITIEDDFIPENACSLVLNVEKGKLGEVETGDQLGEYEVELSLDVADFSSLMMGSAKLKSLYLNGLAKIEPEEEWERVDRLFEAGERPVCYTVF